MVGSVLGRLATGAGVILLTATFVPHTGVASAAKRPLEGHVLGALSQAEAVTAVPGARASETVAVTVTLRRDDQAGFERHLAELYDRRSPHFRRFLTQQQIAERFGPSQASYDRVLVHLRDSGLEIVEQTPNRLTVTAEGSRAQIERAFGTSIRDYRIGTRSFYANAGDPQLPAEVASHIAAVSGLSSLARPRAQEQKIKEAWAALVAWSKSLGKLNAAEQLGQAAAAASSGSGNNGTTDPPGGWMGNDGTGQTIGVVAFDTFDPADIVDFLALMQMPASQIDKLSQVHVAGGAPPGEDEDEVLLDVTAIMSVAPGAEVVVYDGPFTGRNTSFQRIFNRMVSDGVTIISNSWAYCEDQTTLADVQSIDAIFQSAAMAGITVLNASGDTGSTCLNGSPNVVAVPASSPSATAVGGSSMVKGPAMLYESETWWNGNDHTPPTGQGGFGVSQFFARPAYQNGFHAGANRSIPDVVVNADPGAGVVICQASAGGCPSGLLYGGTSVAAPIWAAYVAILNQAQGSNLGAINPIFYPLSETDGFHDAESMGSDFAHVGLGSPNLNALHLQLTEQARGAVDVDQSQVVHAYPWPGFVLPPDVLTRPKEVPADGETPAYIVVRLRDANGHTIPGKTITLEADSEDVVIEPASVISTEANGAAVFTATNLVAENVRFTATNETDSMEVGKTDEIVFAVPPAASAGIQAFPLTVTANGLDTTTITVTLEDALGRPTPGKLIRISQGNGHSLIQGPNPTVTDENGQIQFTATNTVNEMVTYTAVDVTDGDLPIPGNPTVTFNNGSGNACGSSSVPTADNGFVLVPYVNGFKANNGLSFGNINFGGCVGAHGPAFLGDQVYFTNFFNGDVFRLPIEGGAATDANKIGTVGPTLGWPVVGRDGRIYATRSATTGSFTTGAVVELDPETGTVIRNVASNIKCPQGLVVDPLTGDLFVDGGCFGAGSDDPAIRRISDLDQPTPTVEIYTNLPFTPNGNLAIAPDGTMYVVSGYLNTSAQVYRVSGTSEETVTITPVPGVTSLYWTTVAEVDENGHALSLLTHSPDGADLRLTDIRDDTPTSTVIAHFIGGGVIGPDGCFYGVGNGTTAYRLTDADGGCSFATNTASASLTLAPTSVDPDPAQGTTQTFTATLLGVEDPTDAAIFFEVTGANPRVQLVRADANGVAELSYLGSFPGDDVVVAKTQVGEEMLESPKARVTWTPGDHETYLTLNPSPTSSEPAGPVDLVAVLSDVSQSPAERVEGAVVEFDLNGATCSDTTDADGVATCQVTSPSDTGSFVLSATFEPSEGLLGDADSQAFDVVGVLAISTTSTTLPAGVCGDGNDNGTITATDALFVLRTAVGTETCALCVCDVDSSGTTTATDASRVLRFAVGQAVSLNCPGCAG